MAVEDLKHAQKRKANILGEIRGFGYYFDPYRIHKYNPKGTGVKEAIRKCLNNAELEPKDIDYICSNANSTIPADKIETEAIKEIFGKRSRKYLEKEAITFRLVRLNQWSVSATASPGPLL